MKKITKNYYTHHLLFNNCNFKWCSLRVFWSLFSTCVSEEINRNMIVKVRFQRNNRTGTVFTCEELLFSLKVSTGPAISHTDQSCKTWADISTSTETAATFYKHPAASWHLLSPCVLNAYSLSKKYLWRSFWKKN